MEFDFYNKLSFQDKARYGLMLKTNYVLLRCDEQLFMEKDEYGEETRSLSWIHSIQPTLELFGLDIDSYPQGSLSANRHYYEALRNYFGGDFSNVQNFNHWREYLINFIRLRRDDSCPNSNYLYGSYYEIRALKGSRDSRNVRFVHSSPRHSATSLWLMCEESNIDEKLKKSIVSFIRSIEEYLNENHEWKRDGYKLLTLSSAINAFSSIMNKCLNPYIHNEAERIKRKCKEIIVSEKCMNELLDGNYEWIMPSIGESKMTRYEYYLNAFSLCQVPELMRVKKVQSLVRGMINNRVNSKYGDGIPIHKIINFALKDEINPDFGSTSSVLYLLWYCLENKVGDRDWLNYCSENFDWLLKCSLDIYNKPECYVLPHSENNTKVMLMPRYERYGNDDDGVEEYINKIKRLISIEMRYHKGELSKRLQKIKAPEGLEHVAEIIDSWNIQKYWKKQKRWTFDDGINKFGDFLGGYTVGIIRAIAKSV